MPDHSHSLMPDTYQTRALDKKITKLLNISTVIDLRGIWGSGKTWCALSHVKSIISADESTIAIPLIQMDERIALAGLRPHAVDEWSAFPDLGTKARRASADPGSFMLLTSIEPEEPRRTQHLGSRQVTTLRMRTLTLAERGLSGALVSLEELVATNGSSPALPEYDGCTPPLESAALETLALPACEGGWSAAIGRPHEDALVIAANQVNQLIALNGRRQSHNESIARSVLVSIELATGGDTSYAALARRGAEAGFDLPSRNTVSAYVRSLERLYLIEKLPGWRAPVRSASRVKTKPRLILADPSVGIAAAGLGLTDVQASGLWLEAGFRALTLHDLLAYAEALPLRFGARVAYYADADGLSVDAVLLLQDESWAPVAFAAHEANSIKARGAYFS